jgi:DNA polymerase
VEVVSIVTLDFETYYSKDFSLSKMTTEEYVNDPRFQVIGVGIKIDDAEPYWVTSTSIRREFAKIDWDNAAVLCHNTLFDGFILSAIYKIIPGFYFDTLSMAKAINGIEVGGSLKALAVQYGIGEKGEEVINALGKRLEDFTSEELARYGEYCINDVELTYKLFQILSSAFPDNEYKLIDLTVRMFTDPMLMVDDFLLNERLESLKQEKKDLLTGLMEATGCDNEESVRKILSSNPQFAGLLEQFGVPAPKKISPTTGKETYALAKNDEAFIALQEHEDPTIQQLCAVRLGTKSTLEESRIERFIGIGARNRSYLPVPLRYYGAHTGRWAGMDSVNFQNLPSRDKRKKALKNSILAPENYVIINCDSSQIEARVLAWLAGQDDVTRAFANGDDVYSEFATKVFNRPISKANPVERFVGKTCVLGLGYGTGAAKLQHTLKTQPPGAELDLEECKRIVNLYRETNYKIPELWRECDSALLGILSGVSKPFALANGTVWIDSTGIRLPNGLHIRYPSLRYNEEGKMIYTSRRGPVNIWGGAMVENIVQALARIIVGEQMVWVAERYRPVLTVHDAIVCVVPVQEKEQALEFIIRMMSTAPSWCKTLPVACEAKMGASYGDC